MKKQLIYIGMGLLALACNKPNSNAQVGEESEAEILEVQAPAEEHKEVLISCNVDGTPFKGTSFFNSLLYYPNGIVQLGETTPFAQLAFKDAEGKNDWQLTLTLKPYTGSIGKLSNFEIALSGTKNGQSVLSGSKRYMKESEVNITKFEEKAGVAVLSGTFYGKIDGIMKGMDVMNISEGRFENLEVSLIK